MANPVTQDRYALSSAALASGASPKTIRNWIDRELLKVVRFTADDEREGTGWRRFSVRDIVIFALIKRLADFGVPIENAAYVVWSMPEWESPKFHYKNTPPIALAAGLKFTRLWVCRDGDGWASDTTQLPDEPLPENLPDTVLTIDVGRVAASVVQALQDLDEAEGGEE